LGGEVAGDTSQTVALNRTTCVVALRFILPASNGLGRTGLSTALPNNRHGVELML
jgi:hypothetical protein